MKTVVTAAMTTPFAVLPAESPDFQSTLTGIVALIPLTLTLLLFVGGYVWTAIAMGGVFRKAGIDAWKAWVPILNQWTFLVLGSVPGWWAAALPAAALIPAIVLLPALAGIVSGITSAGVVIVAWLLTVIIAIVAAVVHIIAVARVTQRFALGFGMVMLGVLLLPAWASVITWGPARWQGKGPGDLLAEAPVTVGSDTAMHQLFAPPPTGPISEQIPLPAPSSGQPVAEGLPVEPAARDLQPQIHPPVAALRSDDPVQPPSAEWPSPPAADMSAAAADLPSATEESGLSLRPRPYRDGPRDSAAATEPPPDERPAPAPAPAPADDSTTVLTTADDTAEDRTLLSARRGALEPWTLELPDGGSVLLTAQACILGRRPIALLAVPGAQLVTVTERSRTISKNHALLQRSDDGWTITDLNSTNGTSIVDRHGLEQTVTATADAGTRFFLGDAEFRLSQGTPA